MRRIVHLVGATAIGLVGACAAASSSSNGDQAVNEDERGNVGPAHPGWEYCRKLGYTYDAQGCLFPDGSHCDPVLLYNGTCGQHFTYCEQHGGTLTSEERDFGWHGVFATCRIDGKICWEQDFVKTGACGP